VEVVSVSNENDLPSQALCKSIQFYFIIHNDDFDIRCLWCRGAYDLRLIHEHGELSAFVFAIFTDFPAVGAGVAGVLPIAETLLNSVRNSIASKNSSSAVGSNGLTFACSRSSAI
jgi:hypothetical protein